MVKGIRTKERKSICKVCGCTFYTTATRHYYCDERCCEKASKQRRAYNIPSRMRELANAAKYRAKAKDLFYELSPEFVLNLWELQEGCCALTGTPFDLSLGDVDGVANKDGPSLDREIPWLGYVQGNVRLVTFQTNIAKGYYSDDDLYEFCKRIIKGRAF